MGASLSRPPPDGAGAAAAAAAAAATGRPDPAAPSSSSSSRPVYDVYGRRIDTAPPPSAGCPVLDGPLADVDPKNNMPRTPAQAPCAGQRAPLSTSRAASTIPKTGADGTWTYPSPQMFFNALRRKGKGGDVSEGDVDGVVAAHNGMNEATWARVAAWESMHAGECPDGRPPTLTRFVGRPHDLSPAARVAAWFGGPLPFDRHDWYVDRCGREVRYVIDFYYDEACAGTPAAFDLRVRPALDAPGALLDRTKMTVYTTFAALGLPCPVTGAPGAIGAAASGRK